MRPLDKYSLTLFFNVFAFSVLAQEATSTPIIISETVSTSAPETIPEIALTPPIEEPATSAPPVEPVPQPTPTPPPESRAALNPDVFHIPAAPYPRGLSLIFFADGYLSWDEFNRDTQTLMRAIKTVEPWKSYSRYNIYQIRPKELDICGVKIADERKPVLRCSPDGINRYLNQLNTDRFKLVVLSRRTFQSWANVVRLQDSGIFFSMPQSPTNPADETIIGWLFLHMVGHAFGLKDEETIVIAKAHSAPHEPDGPNCAPDRATAKQWWGILRVSRRESDIF